VNSYSHEKKWNHWKIYNLYFKKEVSNVNFSYRFPSLKMKCKFYNLRSIVNITTLQIHVMPTSVACTTSPSVNMTM
jgi:hypothetical protein